MAKGPSLAALKERNLRVAPAAQELVESLVEGSFVERECDQCGAMVQVKIPDRLRLQAAEFVLKSAGVGPVTRVQDEEPPPTDPRALLIELRAVLAELSEAERMDLLLEFAPEPKLISAGDA